MMCFLEGMHVRPASERSDGQRSNGKARACLQALMESMLPREPLNVLQP